MTERPVQGGLGPSSGSSPTTDAAVGAEAPTPTVAVDDLPVPLLLLAGGRQPVGHNHAWARLAEKAGVPDPEDWSSVFHAGRRELVERLVSREYGAATCRVATGSSLRLAHVIWNSDADGVRCVLVILGPRLDGLTPPASLIETSIPLEVARSLQWTGMLLASCSPPDTKTQDKLAEALGRIDAAVRELRDDALRASDVFPSVDRRRPGHLPHPRTGA